MTERRLPHRTLLFEVALLFGLVTAFTVAGAMLYPVWDDARLMFVIAELGSPAIWSNFSNRPLIALFYTFLFNHQLFLPVAIVLHWAAWVGMGLVTMRFWRLMFPAHARFALLPALFSVAPILCKVQLVVLTIPTIDLLGPVLSYVAIFMFLSDQSYGWRRVFTVAAGLALIVLSILVSEYAVITAALGFILMCAKAVRETGERRRERGLTAVLISAVALMSYTVFLVVTRQAGWSAYRPGYILESFSLKVPFRWLSGIWRGAIGGVLEALGAINLNSKAALLSFGIGAVFAGLVVLVTHSRNEIEFSLKREKTSVVILLVSLGIALLPVVLMDRTLESKWDSRFWLPVLPVASSLSVYILFFVLRPRLYFLVPILCGFLAAYCTTSEITQGFQNPETLVQHSDHNSNWAEAHARNQLKVGGGA